MRVVRFIFRNWTLKVGALLLAIILYVGMVALQSTQQWPGTIPITPVNQPETAFLIKPEIMPTVGSIRYIAPADVPVSKDSFTATIDLKEAKVDASASTLVKVQLVADDQRIQIIDYQPQQVSVTLDKIVTRSIPVKVETGTPPAGLSLGPQAQSLSTVAATGASSRVALVVQATAQVPIDASGLDVNKEVPLVPVDANGNKVQDITLDHTTVQVSIQIGSQLRTQTVAVEPVVRGSPAAGYYVTSIDVSPLVVSVSGEADALAALNGAASTQPISIAGATGDVSIKVALNLPSGVEAPDVTTVTVVVHMSSPATTRTVTIGIVPDGARPDRTYALSTPSVTVTLGGAAAALNAFDTSSLVGIVSVGSLDPGAHSVQIKITVPSGIKLVSVNPDQITVTVSIPPSPPPSVSPQPS
ncbi:MAG: CdaR family protein [Candidatus Limnocylindrales bacterium]|jgi:YbbR domain-containing protein